MACDCKAHTLALRALDLSEHRTWDMGPLYAALDSLAEADELQVLLLYTRALWVCLEERVVSFAETVTRHEQGAKLGAPVASSTQAGESSVMLLVARPQDAPRWPYRVASRTCGLHLEGHGSSRGSVADKQELHDLLV